jgi:Holliday junction resolvase
MRPRYESASDVDNELLVVTELCDRWHCTARKVPISYHFDYVLMRGKPVAVVEIKCRKRRYETLILSLQKAVMLHFYAQQMGVKPLIVVHWDKTYFTALQPVRDYQITWGGRIDRNDDQDMEPVIHIPSEDFIPV